MSATELPQGLFPEAHHDERGQALPLALIVLAVGSLLVISFLSAATTSIRGSGQVQSRLQEQTAADAGMEHAMWRVRYDAAFLSGLVPSTPTTYLQTIGNMSVNISVTLVPTPAPPPTPVPTATPQSGPGIQVAKLTDPASAVPNQTTVFTYTIQIINIGTSTVHFEEIWDILPPGFTYVPGSSSGVTTAEPTLSIESGRQKVDWMFQAPLPEVRQGETGLQIFQATATLDDGTYYNEAWVKVGPDSIDQVGSGWLGLVTVTLPQYDIRATAGSLATRSRVGVQDGTIRIRSWKEE